MELQVINKQGVETGKTVTLPQEVFGIEPNQHAVYLDVKQYLANQRQGTHASKERADVARTTKKLKKQKGTGGARAGSMKSPLFKGGGRVFGPRPRNYSFKLNRKLKTLARKSALSAKAIDAKIAVLEDFNFDAPSTKQYLAFLNAVNLAGNKTLFVTAEVNKNVYLSSRNLQKAKVTTVDSLNTYEILNADTLLFTESALNTIQANLTK